MRDWTILAGLAVALAACGTAEEPTASGPDDGAAPPAATVPEAADELAAPPPPMTDGATYPGQQADGAVEQTASGLQYIVVAEGDGASPAPGSRVLVRYSGYLMDGTPFDSGEIPFAIGQGAVIPGWDEGIAMMQVGGQRKLIIPPELAYGAAGAPGVIPPNSTLVFDVELLSIE